MSDEGASSIAKSKARAYVELVSAVAAILLAIAAYIKPETSTRKTYDVLARQLETQSEDIAKTHDDVVALRNYLDGYIRAQAERGTTAKVEPIVPAPAPVASSNAVVKIVPLEHPQAPPEVGARPGTFAPPSYVRVTGKEDIR